MDRRDFDVCTYFVDFFGVKLRKISEDVEIQLTIIRIMIRLKFFIAQRMLSFHSDSAHYQTESNLCKLEIDPPTD